MLKILYSNTVFTNTVFENAIQNILFAASLQPQSAIELTEQVHQSTAQKSYKTEFRYFQIQTISYHLSAEIAHSSYIISVQG